MLGGLWDEMAKELAGPWTARKLVPALGFWLVGLVVYVTSGARPATISFLMNDLGAPLGAFVIVVTLSVVTLTAFFMQNLSFWLLRLLEGYWPRWVRSALTWPGRIMDGWCDAVDKRWEAKGVRPRLWQRRTVRWLLGQLQSREHKLAQMEERWEELQALPSRSERQDAELIRLEQELALYPAARGLLLPTRLGNVLRAAEEHPYLRYGLEPTTVWPRLWLVLPEATRTELTEASGSVDERVVWFAWSLLAVIWGVWALGVVPLALVAAYIAHRLLLLSVGNYATLIRAAFDMHRFALYDGLHWALPEDTDSEKLRGAALTAYLLRGPLGLPVRFEHPEGKDGA